MIKTLMLWCVMVMGLIAYVGLMGLFLVVSLLAFLGKTFILKPIAYAIWAVNDSLTPTVK